MDKRTRLGHIRKIRPNARHSQNFIFFPLRTIAPSAYLFIFIQLSTCPGMSRSFLKAIRHVADAVSAPIEVDLRDSGFEEEFENEDPIPELRGRKHADFITILPGTRHKS